MAGNTWGRTHIYTSQEGTARYSPVSSRTSLGRDEGYLSSLSSGCDSLFLLVLPPHYKAYPASPTSSLHAIPLPRTSPSSENVGCLEGVCGRYFLLTRAGVAPCIVVVLLSQSSASPSNPHKVSEPIMLLSPSSAASIPANKNDRPSLWEMAGP